MRAAAPFFVPCALVLALASLLLGGCGQSTAPARMAAATATPSPSATTEPTSTPLPTPTGVLGQCFGYGADMAGTTTQVGDILFTQVKVSGLAYPFLMLPDGTNLAHPYQMKAPGDGEFLNSPVTNPGLADFGGGFMFGVCNGSATKSHTVQAMTARIDAFTAYTGQLSQWNICDATLSSHKELTGGGCGGAMGGCMCFHAPFSSGAGAGAEVTMTQTQDVLDQPGDHSGKLPLALAPHHGFFLYAGMDKPQAAGRYTFSFGVRIDAQSTTLRSGVSPVVLLAPVAHHWDGTACQQNPAMSSQIAPTNPETYYICPES